MYNSHDEYERSSDVEIDNFLADLPFDLIRENIKKQLTNPIDIRIDYLEGIFDKYNVAREMYEDKDMIESITSTVQSFCMEIIRYISDTFNMDIDVERVSSEYDNIETCKFIYEFMILRYKQNISRFLYKFIKNNKKSIVDNFTDNKKDISTLAYKKVIKNKDDLTIISNLPEIIKYIIDLDVSPEVFIDTCVGNNGAYQGMRVRELISDNIIVGNFVDTYISLCTDDYDYVLDEIMADIKSKLLK